jgi:hypothetical protein
MHAHSIRFVSEGKVRCLWCPKITILSGANATLFP